MSQRIARHAPELSPGRGGRNKRSGELIAAIKEMVAAVSYSETGRAFDLTRNQVAGIVWRARRQP